ncbi:GH92 family glycosyl hydrolase, partial [Sedimentisphaera salicampi]|uniref:GH92 family glycosyl hydrolase n=1 Tax=Sedimentisphaera salicampi TaxID=1941349 RepID=UPI001054AB36
FDEDGEMVHYSPYNGKVLPGYMFTDNGFWDTFRAVFPFFTVMYPELNADIMKGLVNTYKESGWLPEWASPGHRDCMVGSNSASIIANTYLSGIRGYDIETLYEAILKNSENQHPNLSSVGRLGVDYYNEKGYIPCDVGVNESIARTLEYSYADYTIWKLAKALDKPKEHIKRFRKRAQFYRNVFDESTDFMRGKKESGKWQSPFVPEKWGGVFTEGSAWHYTWSVFQDPQGLMNLMGGKESFTEKLDSVFSTPPKYDASYYGFPIHEIIEMTVVDMGQYAHGNQPIQHMIYLYNYAGQPWKAQKWIREVMDRLYQPTPDGLCGDEDNGQTSAWYVFSALGFYPVCPGSGEFVIGSPIFEEAEMKLENGNTFTVEAEDNCKDNIYIETARLNGKPYSKTYLNYEDIQNGGRVSFDMSDKPNKDWGDDPSDAPYSMSKELE